MWILPSVGSGENHVGPGAYMRFSSKCKGSHTRRGHSFTQVASDGTWKAESCSQGALSRYSFSWRHSPVRGSAWTFRFLRLEYLRNLRRRRQFLTLGLPWLNAFRRVELDLASWSPWGHFSASNWTGFKRVAFTSFRTLACLRICLRTIGRVCLENT